MATNNMSTGKLSRGSIDHKKTIVGARRRNNIYGELTDYIAMPFLSKGGDGLIYNTAETDEIPVTFYGRSQNAMYAVKVFYRNESSDPSPVLDDNTKQLLITVADRIGAVPLYAIAHVYSSHCKFYYAKNGAKVQGFA